MIKIGLCGATGRMGVSIKQEIDKFTDKCLIAAEFSSTKNIDELADFCQKSDVVIDFSTPDILVELLKYASMYNAKLVIGTTGFKDKHFNLLQHAALNNAIIYSANMSVGANVVAKLAASAAKVLDNEYDVEIVDAHHRFKKDAPSGTALMYGRLISAARGINFDQDKEKFIGFSSIRGGGIIGEHEIIFAGNDEVITIKHQALNRKIYAGGAIKAACWIVDKQAGLYSMQDVINV